MPWTSIAILLRFRTDPSTTSQTGSRSNCSVWLIRRRICGDHFSWKNIPRKRGWYGICLIYILICGIWLIFIYIWYGIWYMVVWHILGYSPPRTPKSIKNRRPLRGSYDINHWASRWVAWDQNRETLNFKLPFAFDKRVPGFGVARRDDFKQHIESYFSRGNWWHVAEIGEHD